MDYKNFRPVIKKLGKKGDPVNINTSPVQAKLDQINDDVLDEEAVKQTIQENFMFDTKKENSLELENMGEFFDDESEADDITYKVGDIAKSIRNLKNSKNIKPKRAYVAEEQVDKKRMEEELNNMESILTNLKTLKDVTAYEKPKTEVQALLKEDIPVQPINPNADSLQQLVNSFNNKSTQKEEKSSQGDFEPLKTDDEPKTSKELFDSLNFEPLKQDDEDTALQEKFDLLKKLEREKAYKDSREYRRKQFLNRCRAVPFSKVDLRKVSDDEPKKSNDDNDLAPLYFSENDLRKSDQDNQDEFWTVNQRTEKTTSSYYDQFIPQKNEAVATEAIDSNITSQNNVEEYEYGEIIDNSKPEQHYGQVVEQKTAPKKEKSKFISDDAKATRHFAWLAYIFFFIPLLINRNSAYVKHSANEGLEINLVDLFSVILILVGKFVTPGALFIQGILIGFMIIGSILLILTTVTKLFMITATLKGKYVNTPWFWNIELIK